MVKVLVIMFLAMCGFVGVVVSEKAKLFPCIVLLPIRFLVISV